MFDMSSGSVLDLLPVSTVGGDRAVGPSVARLVGLLEDAAALPPGPRLVSLLDRVDPQRLSAADRVRLLQQWERVTRWVAARQADAVVAVAGQHPDAEDTGREDVRVALAGVAGTPGRVVDTARALHSHLRAARTALAAGIVSVDHVRVLREETDHLPAAVAATVCTAVVPTSPDAARTPSAWRRVVRRAALRADPDAADLAAVAAATQRAVTFRVDPSTQATLTVTGPAPTVLSLWQHLDAAARGAAAEGAGRTLDQRRFDALAGLVLGGDAAVRATVHLHADLATWTALLDDAPAADPVGGPGAGVELTGYGPVPPGVAQSLLRDARFRAVLVETLTRAPLATSTSSYRPTPALRRLLALRDHHCLFPGCSAGAHHCDADHNTPHGSGGATSPGNTGLLCRRHHRLKTHHGWTWARDPDGTARWTDPYGRSWTRPPEHDPPRLTA